MIFSQVKPKTKTLREKIKDRSSKRLKTRNVLIIDNQVNQSLKNFETQYVKINLKEIDPQSTFQSSRAPDSSRWKSDRARILNSPNEMLNKLAKSKLKQSSWVRVNPKNFWDLDDSTYKREDLKIETNTDHIKDSPVKQYIYDSLRNKGGINTEIFKKQGEKDDLHHLFQRNNSKESDMWRPVSWQESDNSMNDESPVPTLDQKLEFWAKFDKKRPNDNFDIRQQLFKAFGYNQLDEEFYISRRRGAVENDTIDLGNNTNRFLHIRQPWDPSNKITPSSSMRTSEFSRLNKMEDSEASSEKNPPLFKHRREEEKIMRIYDKRGIKKRARSPKIEKKGNNSLHKEGGDENFTHSSSMK